MENVIAVAFGTDSSAYEAMTKLKELESQDQIDIKGVAVVTRDADGRIEEKDAVGGDSWGGTASGGMIGLLIGILGGPLGILIGGATGLLVGSAFDFTEDDDTESVLGAIANSIEVGRTGLIADVDEPSPEVIDSAMERLGGSVLRKSADEVESEIAAAEDAQRAARREARKQLREAKQARTRAQVQSNLDALKAKLHRGAPAA